mgnify:CR=1 FL=1
MTKNMGTTDKVIRIVIALALAALIFTETITGTLGTVAIVVAAVFLLTSAPSFCPLYTLVGVKTCKA